MTIVKVVYCLRRLPELSRADFHHHYWATAARAPLVARHAEVLGIVRYVQNHTVDHRLAGALIGERGSTDELLADERRFIDLENSSLFATRADDHCAAASTANTSTMS